MDITDTSRPTAFNAPPSSTQNSTAEDGTAAISSDFETFLRMLTAQIENQDPLNPVDSTDFATQLATFSSVEQQVLTNDLLTNLGAELGALGMSQLSTWVGMNANAIMPVNFNGDPVRIVTEGSDLADKAHLVVRNDAGAEVARYEVPTSRQQTLWQPVGPGGQPLPLGTYQLEVESSLQGEVVGTSAVLVEGRIIEARNENGVPLLVMNTGQEVSSADIVGLREPG